MLSDALYRVIPLLEDALARLQELDSDTLDLYPRDDVVELEIVRRHLGEILISLEDMLHDVG